MAKASNNEYPSVLFDEQASAPTTPGSGLWRAYFKSDGLYVVDDAGTETGPLVDSAGGGGGVAAESFRATRITSHQSISAATHTKVEFNDETWDTGGNYDPTTNHRYTATNAGKYHFTTRLQLAGAANSRKIITIYKNGSEYLRLFSDDPTDVTTSHTVSADVDLAATDYVEIFAWIESGSLTVNIGSTFSGFRFE